MGDVGAAVVVDGHVAALVGVHAGGLQAELLAVGDRADGQQGVGAPGGAPVVAADDHLVAVAVDAHGPRPLEQADASAQQLVLEGGGDLGVLLGQDLLAGHDERDLAAERGEHVHELDAGDARADDHEVLGPGGRGVGLAGRQHAVAVDGGPVGQAGTAAGGEEHGVGLDLDGTVGGVGHDGVRAGETARAPEDPHVLAGQQPAGVALDALLDAPQPVAQGIDVDAGGGLDEAHLRRAAHGGEGAAGGDHGLRRDAVPQVGGATDDVALDHGDLGAQPGGVGRGRVPTRSPADDHEASRHRLKPRRRPDRGRRAPARRWPRGWRRRPRARTPGPAPCPTPACARRAAGRRPAGG